MNLLGAGRIPFAFLIDFLSEKPIIVPLDQCASRQLFFIIPGKQIVPEHQTPLPAFGMFHPKPVSRRSYKRAFKLVQENQEAGNSYLTNLTFSTRVMTNYTPEMLFGKLGSKYQVLYRDEFVCFSPETFLTIREGIIRSYPMKGTIDANIPDAENVLRANPKEMAEHNTITDLIRNDLNMIASGVAVTRPCYIDTIEAQGKRLLQMSSEISGQLSRGWQGQLGDILYNMLPAGSITGAPKEKTVEIILRTEDYQRGYYTGVFGVFDGNEVDSCVLIRYLEQNPKGFFHFKSGGGITIRSKYQDEYNELNQKIYVPLV